MKIISCIFSILSFHLAISQEQKPPPPPAPNPRCIYSKKYSESDRLRIYPFSDYNAVRLVSFCFHRDSLPVTKDRLIVDSLIENVALSEKEIVELTDLLYNNHLSEEVPPQESLCIFQPRNAILFFDDIQKLRAYSLICFHCMDYQNSNERMNVGDACTGKIEELRKFFIAKGVKFGTDLKVEKYPGETGICCE